MEDRTEFEKYLARLRQILIRSDEEELEVFFDAQNPDDIVDEIYELNESEFEGMINLLSDEKLAVLMDECGENLQFRVADLLDPDRLEDVADDMRNRTAADALVAYKEQEEQKRKKAHLNHPWSRKYEPAADRVKDAEEEKQNAPLTKEDREALEKQEEENEKAREKEKEEREKEREAAREERERERQRLKEEKWEADQKKLQQILDDADADELKDFFDSQEPIDFALEIEDFDDIQLRGITDLLEDDDLASLLEESEDDQRIRIARLLDNRRLLIAFQYMQKDDIVDMLGDFPIGRRKQVINLMKLDERKIITKLLQYPDDSAGGLMTTAYIALRGDLRIGDALKKIQEIGPKTEIIETIYVLDDMRRLIGKADLRNILASPKNSTLDSIMDDQVISVEPELDQEEVAHLVSKYDLNVLPVVSRTRQILGVITVDDVLDVIVEEYDADMLQMAGVSSEEDLDTTLPESVRHRLPWLLVNLATAFLASFTVKLFEGTIAQVVALSAIMTIVSGMGGNAGTQTMSVLVRDLAKGNPKWDKLKKPFFKEILLGLIDGAANGLVTGLIVWMVYRNLYLGIITFFAMIGNLLVSAIFGFLVPVLLKKMHADPAIASSIFVTTATDVLGFFIFLGLASIFLPYLM
ncbi:MAG: magnesium transporter [Eubacterium sp.]|nr:magnesium transporter [Eubacterium sp.]